MTTYAKVLCCGLFAFAAMAFCFFINPTVSSEGRGAFDAGSENSSSEPEGGLLGVPQHLLASDGTVIDRFGTSVAVSGDMAIVGSSGDDVDGKTDQGSVYVFTKVNGVWNETQHLTAPDGVANIFYGISVSLSGDTLAVGTSQSAAGYTQGVYVYTRCGDLWCFQHKIVAGIDPADLAYPDGFGQSVAISEDTIVIGAPSDDLGSASSTLNYGSSFVYTRSGNQWNFQQKLTPSTTAASAVGSSVGISGETLVLGQGSTAVWVYIRSGSTWSEQQRLTPTGGSFLNIRAAIDGETIVVGSSFDDVSGATDQGSAYFFTRSGTMWSQQGPRLTADDGLAFDMFGSRVAIRGNTALISATGDDIGAVSNAGSAYIFNRNGTTWTKADKFTAPDAAIADGAGGAVALSATDAIVGVAGDDVNGNTDQGSAWVMSVGLVPDIRMRRPNTASLTALSIGATDIDEPLEFNTNKAELGLAPSVGKGLVADGVTPLLFDLEIAGIGAAAVQVDVEIEILSGGTVDGEAIENRMRYLSDNVWSDLAQLSFTQSENRNFAYLEPIGSDELQFDSGENEIEVELRLLNATTDEELGAKTFFIRKPPIALVHGYNTNGDWGPLFKGELAASRPMPNGEEDFVRTIKYGQTPEGAAAHTLENTILPFEPLAEMVLAEFTAMKVSFDNDWALTRYDVVAHSQGGILTRMLTSRNGNTFVPQPFRNPDNFYRGRFHRVVTIGSPHNGTRLVRYLARLREINQNDWAFVGLANSSSSALISSGLAQYKFDPIDQQITKINRTDDDAPWLPDEDADFHLVATRVNNGAPPDDEFYSHTEAAIGLNSPSGTIVLPEGSDGVVDFHAMLATSPSAGQMVPDNTYIVPSSLAISHAYFNTEAANNQGFTDPFGGTDGQVLSNHVGRHVIRALDQSDLIPTDEKVFGPFQVPLPISQDQVTAINQAADAVSGLEDAIQQDSFSSRRVANSKNAAALANYTYNFQLPPGETFAGPVLWTAERYGVAGTGATGLTVTSVPGFPGRVELSVDTTIAGDVVLKATAKATSGKVFIGEPVLVVSTDPNPSVYSRTSISVDPSSGTFTAGSGVFPVLYEHYTNIASPGSPGLKLRRWIYNSALQSVSTNPAVVDPSSTFEWKFRRAGQATVNLTWRGLSTSAALTIYGSSASSLFDYTDDLKADVSVFRSSDGVWYIKGSTGNDTTLQWGGATDRIAPADYDGDGKTDVAIFRPSEGNWYVLNSQSGTMNVIQWGNANDVIVPSFYDADAKADIAIFRPTEGNWYINNSQTSTMSVIQWGNATDKPVPADFDGDGKSDVAVYRPSEGTWYVFNSQSGTMGTTQWGNSTDIPVAATYDTDQKADIAIFRPSEGNWYIFNTTDFTMSVIQWGNSTDKPVPADYDGDGRTDIAIYRPSQGNWYINNSQTSSMSVIQWGNSTDIPTPSAYR